MPTYPSYTTKTDGVDIVYAADVNDLQTEVARIARGAAHGYYSNVESITANKTLTDADLFIQTLTPNAARDVTLPAVANTNHAYLIANGSGSYALTVKNAGGTTIITCAALSKVMVWSDGVAWYGAQMATSASGGGDKYAVEGRLTLTSGTPVTASDVTGATSVYFTPFCGNQIGLYSGGAWSTVTFTETTLALGTLTSGKPYDVFGYSSGGSLALESLAWTNDTTRATALTTQDGVLVKSGDATRRYLGTFYTTSTTQTEDSAAKRYLYNHYNKMPKKLLSYETTNTWSYGTATTWRAINNATAYGTSRVGVMIGWQESLVELTALLYGSVAAGFNNLLTGIGLDSTSANSAQLFVWGDAVAGAATANTTALYKNYTAVGMHYLQHLEYVSNATYAVTIHGDNGGTHQTGMTGTVIL